MQQGSISATVVLLTMLLFLLAQRLHPFARPNDACDALLTAVLVTVADATRKAARTGTATSKRGNVADKPRFPNLEKSHDETGSQINGRTNPSQVESNEERTKKDKAKPTNKQRHARWRESKSGNHCQVGLWMRGSVLMGESSQFFDDT